MEISNKEEKKTWDKVISRADFWKIYFEDFGMKDSISVDRLTLLDEIMKFNSDLKFKFAIVKKEQNKSISNVGKYDTDKHFFICPDPNYSEDHPQISDNMVFLSLAMTGFYHKLEETEAFKKDLNKWFPDSNEIDPVINFQKLYDQKEIRDKHNSIAEDVFSHKLYKKVEKNYDYSLFLMKDKNLLEFNSRDLNIYVVKEGISELKIQEEIYNYLKVEADDNEENQKVSNIVDIIVFSDQTKLEDEEITTSDTKQITINLIMTIIFVINFFFVIPPNLFYDMKTSLEDFFEKEPNGRNIIDNDVENWTELQIYFNKMLREKIYSNKSIFGFSVTNLETDDYSTSLFTANKTNVVNTTEFKTNSNRYYLMDTNLFCGMLVNFAMSEEVELIDINGDILEKRRINFGYEQTSPFDFTKEFLTFEYQNKDPLYPNTYYLYLNPVLNKNSLEMLLEQYGKFLFNKKSLYLFSFTTLIYNSNSQINAIYTIKFLMDPYGKMVKEKNFYAYQPFLSSNSKDFSFLLILNIIFSVFLAFVTYMVMNSFSNNIIDLIVNRNYQFEWYDWLDLLVIILSLTSEIMLFQNVIFNSSQFTLHNSSFDQFQTAIATLFNTRNYKRLTGVNAYLFRYVFF